eukprot:tig00000073_g1689.t1
MAEKEQPRAADGEGDFESPSGGASPRDPEHAEADGASPREQLQDEGPNAPPRDAEEASAVERWVLSSAAGAHEADEASLPSLDLNENETEGETETARPSDVEAPQPAGADELAERAPLEEPGPRQEEVPIEESKRELPITALRVSLPRSALFAVCCLLTGGLLLAAALRWRYLLATCTHRLCRREEQPQSLLIRERGAWFLVRVRTQRLRARRRSSAVRRAFSRRSASRPDLEGGEEDRAGSQEVVAWFEHRSRRYVQCPDGTFARFGLSLEGLGAAQIEARYARGLSRPEIALRSLLFGRNEIRPGADAFLGVVADELLHQFYFVQAAAVAIWFSQRVFLFGGLVLALSVVSVLWTSLIRWRSARRLDTQLSQSGTRVVVRRRAPGRAPAELKLPSEELLTAWASNPGDVLVVRAPEPAGGRRASTASALAAAASSAGPTTALPLTVPADLLLLRGECLVDESSLRGQALAATKQGLLWGRGAGGGGGPVASGSEEGVLFCGTTLLQVLSREPLLCVVLRTGYATQRGPFFHEPIPSCPVLSHPILSCSRPLTRPPPHPTPPSPQVLYAEEGKHALLRQLGSYFALQTLTAVVAFGVALGIVLGNAHGDPLPASTVFTRCFDFVTVTIPACLILVVSFATLVASLRLRGRGVAVLDPGRLLSTGRTGTVCFDKTGVLTSERVAFWGLQRAAGDTFEEATQNVHAEGATRALERCLALCHTLRAGRQEAGRQIDVEGFRASGWSLLEPEAALRREGVLAIAKPAAGGAGGGAPGGGPGPGGEGYDEEEEWGVVRRFEFDVRRMCSSVLARGLTSRKLVLHCKGAPESIVKMCRPHTVPRAFAKALRLQEERGLTVLACAHRALPFMSPPEIRSLPREEAEAGLTFDGFLLLHNPVRKESPGTVAALAAGRLRICLLTGDGLLTAVSVGRAVGAVAPAARVLAVDHRPEEGGAQGGLVCYDVVDEQRLLSLDAELALDEAMGDGYESDEAGELPSPEARAAAMSGGAAARTVWALTGPAVEALFGAAAERAAERAAAGGGGGAGAGAGEGASAQDDPLSDLREALVRRARVFARVGPSHKTEVVRALEAAGNVTLMIGDGVNDLGGMQESSAALAFGTKEARVVAEYASRRPSTLTALALLQEARCALSTVHDILKFLMFSSILQVRGGQPVES